MIIIHKCSYNYLQLGIEHLHKHTYFLVTHLKDSTPNSDTFVPYLIESIITNSPFERCIKVRCHNWANIFTHAYQPVQLLCGNSVKNKSSYATKIMNYVGVSCNSIAKIVLFLHRFEQYLVSCRKY